MDQERHKDDSIYVALFSKDFEGLCQTSLPAKTLPFYNVFGISKIHKYSPEQKEGWTTTQGTYKKDRHFKQT